MSVGTGGGGLWVEGIVGGGGGGGGGHTISHSFTQFHIRFINIYGLKIHKIIIFFLLRGGGGESV